jgi:hypothetical protein
MMAAIAPVARNWLTATNPAPACARACSSVGQRFSCHVWTAPRYASKFDGAVVENLSRFSLMLRKLQHAKRRDYTAQRRANARKCVFNRKKKPSIFPFPWRESLIDGAANEPGTSTVSSNLGCGWALAVRLRCSDANQMRFPMHHNWLRSAWHMTANEGLWRYTIRSFTCCASSGRNAAEFLRILV